MNGPTVIDSLSDEDILRWLERALHGRESLPRFTPDEPPHLAILRVEKASKPPARDSLRDAAKSLALQFCNSPAPDESFTQELLYLVSAFKDIEVVKALAELAGRFNQQPNLSPATRLAVLATLVDTPPPQSAAFWCQVFEQSPAYAHMALSGLLAINPEQAVAALPRFPNSEWDGQAAALKLGLTWDAMVTPRERFQLVRDVLNVLPRCKPAFSQPILEWAQGKQVGSSSSANPSLHQALELILGTGFTPNTRISKLTPTPESLEEIEA